MPAIGEAAADVIEFVFDGVVEGVGQVFEGNIVEGLLNIFTGGIYGAISDFVENATPDAPERIFKSRKAMSTSANAPKQIIYGRCRIGGQLVYFESTGSDNQYMHMIIVLAPHALEGIDEIYFNEELAFNSSGVAQGDYSGKAQVIKVYGDQTAANSTIVSRLSGWDSSHKLLGHSYIYLRLSYDDEVYSRGMPQVSTNVRGKNDIYDPRDDTTKYTTNHALVVLDYLRWTKGVRAKDEEIDMSKFIEAANISDEPVVSNTDGTATEPRYSVNGTISLSASIIDNLNSISRAGVAQVTYSQGTWSIVPGIFETPILTMDESSLIGGVSFTPGPGKGSMTNTAKGSYIDPAQNFEPVSFAPIAPSNYLTDDGEELATEIPFPFANTPTLARRLAKIIVERERYGVDVTIVVKYEAMRLTVGDRFYLNIERLGWTNKIFRVEKVTPTLSGGISLGLREDDESVWDWDESEALNITPPPPIIIPDRTPIAAPANFEVSETVNEPLQPLGNKSTLRLTSDAPADGRFFYVKYQYRALGEEQWIDIKFDIDDAPKIEVLSNGAEYEFSAQSVSTNNVVSPLRSTLTYKVSNVSKNPGEGDVAPTVPKIKRLELVNRVNDGEGWNQWKGPDAIIRWAKLSTTNGGDIINPEGVTDLHLEGYKIRIEDDQGNVLREEITKDTTYTYSLEKNRKDNIIENGQFSPKRSLVVRIQSLTTTGYFSEFESFEISNPAPAAPGGLTIASNFGSISFQFTLPQDLDFVGVDYYITEGSGDPFLEQPKRLQGNFYSDQGLLIDQLYTIGLTSVDQFGDGGSIAFQVSTRAITVGDLGEIDQPLTLDENGGRIVTNNDGFISVMGAVDRPSVSGSPLIFHAWNGSVSPFWIDANGHFGFGTGLNTITFNGDELNLGADVNLTFTISKSVTVGPTGDFATIGAAIEFLSRSVPGFNASAPVQATITLKSDFVWTEQLIIRNLELSWVTIQTETSVEVDVSSTTLEAFETESGLDYKPVFYVESGSSPLITGIYELSSSGQTDSVPFICAGLNGSIVLEENNVEIDGDLSESSSFPSTLMTVTGGIITANELTIRNTRMPFRIFGGQIISHFSEVIDCDRICSMRAGGKASFYGLDALGIVEGSFVIQMDENSNADISRMNMDPVPPNSDPMIEIQGGSYLDISSSGFVSSSASSGHFLGGRFARITTGAEMQMNLTNIAGAGGSYGQGFYSVVLQLVAGSKVIANASNTGSSTLANIALNTVTSAGIVHA